MNGKPTPYFTPYNPVNAVQFYYIIHFIYYIICPATFKPKQFPICEFWLSPKEIKHMILKTAIL